MDGFALSVGVGLTEAILLGLILLLVVPRILRKLRPMASRLKKRPGVVRQSYRCPVSHCQNRLLVMWDPPEPVIKDGEVMEGTTTTKESFFCTKCGATGWVE